jgi:hypothetical protein
LLRRGRKAERGAIAAQCNRAKTDVLRVVEFQRRVGVDDDRTAGEVKIIVRADHGRAIDCQRVAWLQMHVRPIIGTAGGVRHRRAPLNHSIRYGQRGRVIAADPAANDNREL